MGGAYAAGMAYALMQDPEYAYLLQFVDYLAPYQPEDFSHPDGVLGRQFSSSKDIFNTDAKIKNIHFQEIENFGGLFDIFGHSLNSVFYNFLEKSFDAGIPIYIGKQKITI